MHGTGRSVNRSYSVPNLIRMEIIKYQRVITSITASSIRNNQIVWELGQTRGFLHQKFPLTVNYRKMSQLACNLAEKSEKLYCFKLHYLNNKS